MQQYALQKKDEHCILEIFSFIYSYIILCGVLLCQKDEQKKASVSYLLRRVSREDLNVVSTIPRDSLISGQVRLDISIDRLLI